MSLGGGGRRGSSVGAEAPNVQELRWARNGGLGPELSPCHIIVIIKDMRSDLLGAEGGLPTFMEHFIWQALLGTYVLKGAR